MLVLFIQGRLISYISVTGKSNAVNLTYLESSKALNIVPRIKL